MYPSGFTDPSERTFASHPEKVDAFRDQCHASGHAWTTNEVEKALLEHNGDIHAALRAYDMLPVPSIKPFYPAPVERLMTTATAYFAQPGDATATAYPAQPGGCATATAYAAHPAAVPQAEAVATVPVAVVLPPREVPAGWPERAEQQQLAAAAFLGLPNRGKHWGKQCDRSGQDPIVGWRYSLRGGWNGDTYDLCQAEFDKLPNHEKINYDRIAPPTHTELAGARAQWRSC